jgi:hypothetical protein
MTTHNDQHNPQAMDDDIIQPLDYQPPPSLPPRSGWKPSRLTSALAIALLITVMILGYSHQRRAG